MCIFWPRATMFVNGVYPGKSLKTRFFWVLENPGIWSLQVLESPGKQCFNVCTNHDLLCANSWGKFTHILVKWSLKKIIQSIFRKNSYFTPSQSLLNNCRVAFTPKAKFGDVGSDLRGNRTKNLSNWCRLMAGGCVRVATRPNIAPLKIFTAPPKFSQRSC